MLIQCIHKNIRIKDHEGLLHFYLCNRPVVKVQIVGVVVALDRKTKRITFHVDDCTGIMRCIKFLDSDGYFPQAVEVGMFRDQHWSIWICDSNIHDRNRTRSKCWDTSCLAIDRTISSSIYETFWFSCFMIWTIGNKFVSCK